MPEPTANRLRAWRVRHRLRQRDVADLTGLSVSMVCRLELGERHLRPLDRVRVARALGTSVRELFDLEPQP